MLCILDCIDFEWIFVVDKDDVVLGLLNIFVI